ncbi:MAG: DUF1826 domain-containing protein [Rhodovarius sp.]|nr:DUF1826 domain-containing protein [Rhodovarius sp.]
MSDSAVLTPSSPFAVTCHPPHAQGRIAVASSALDRLADIRADQVNLVILWRELPPALARPAAALAARGPFCAVAETEIHRLADALLARCPAPLPSSLLTDIRLLVTIFSAVCGGPRKLRARLEAIHGPGCWRWHTDAVGLRLLCTYSGPGTEFWTADAGAAAARRLSPDAKGSVLPPGAVAILKGDGFSGSAGGGAIHRSPRAAGRRLLLCLDEAGRIPCD